ncbi:MAG: hypothetical protein KBB56_08955 [Acidobacteria bacterium]|nr:hypothetical protein [Acidobacteriota bacterium]
MATAQGIRAGRAFVELFADDSKLVRGLRQAEQKLKAFGDSIRNMGLKAIGLGSAILAPLGAAAKTFADMGSRMWDMAKRTGVSVEALSALSYAAEQSGAGVDAFENGIRRMQRTLYDAGRGLSTATDALGELGLTIQDLEGLSPEAQFRQLADRLDRIEDPSRKAAIAMTIFGRSGTELLPMLEGGAAALDAYEKHARDLGLIMSTEDAAAADVFGDALSDLWKVLKMSAFAVGAALAPTLKDLSERIVRAAKTVTEWVRENQGFIVSALKVAAVVVAVGIGLTVLGTIISGLGTAFGVLATIITAVMAVLKVLAAVIAFLASPVGLVIAAVVALGAAILYVTGAGGKALAWLGERFKVLKEDALATFGGIADALAAGDISLAAKILWLMLKMEWTRGVNFLEKVWLNFRNFFIKIGYDAWHGLLATVEIVWHALEVGWMATVDFFARLWDGFTGFFAKTWQNIKAGAQKAWNWIRSLFDDSVDLQTENKMVEDRKQAAIASIDDEQKRRAAEREAERQRASELHEATLAGIGQENLDKHAQLDAEYAERMAENEADLAKARQEWREAVDAAKQKRAEKEAGALEGPDDITQKARDALAGLGDIGDLVQAEAAKIGVRGTFNASALQGLAAGNAADRTATATEETAKNTNRLVQAAQTGGLTFA